MKSYVIGVSGASGSGKTTFVKNLVSKVGAESVCVFSLDNYYKPLDKQIKDSNDKVNFDLPEAIDIIRFKSDLDNLLSGKKVIIKEYTFNNPKIIPRELVFEKKSIIIIEGVFIFHYDILKSILDFKIFVKTSDEKCIIRRLGRDLVERNYSTQHTLYDFEHHVWVGYEKYTKPYLKTSDIIINNDYDMEKSTEMVSIFLKSKI